MGRFGRGAGRGEGVGKLVISDSRVGCAFSDVVGVPELCAIGGW